MNKKTKTPTANNAITLQQTNDDFKNAVLIVSFAINIIVLTTWLVARVSAEHAAQLITLL